MTVIHQGFDEVLAEFRPASAINFDNHAQFAIGFLELTFVGPGVYLVVLVERWGWFHLALLSSNESLGLQAFLKQHRVGVGVAYLHSRALGPIRVLDSQGLQSAWQELVAELYRIGFRAIRSQPYPFKLLRDLVGARVGGDGALAG